MGGTIVFTVIYGIMRLATSSGHNKYFKQFIAVSRHILTFVTSCFLFAVRIKVTFAVHLSHFEVSELDPVCSHRPRFDRFRDDLLVVCLLVRRQVAFLVKPLRAIRETAAVRLLSSVDAHVSLEVEVQGELLAAQWTLMRFLALHPSTILILTVWTRTCLLSFALSRNFLLQLG